VSFEGSAIFSILLGMSDIDMTSCILYPFVCHVFLPFFYWTEPTPGHVRMHACRRRRVLQLQTLHYIYLFQFSELISLETIQVIENIQYRKKEGRTFCILQLPKYCILGFSFWSPQDCLQAGFLPSHFGSSKR